MLAVSLHQILETVLSDPTRRNLTGTYSNPDQVMTAAAMARLDASFSGPFCLVLFQPEVDAGIDRYLAKAAAQESGTDIFVLFPVGRPVSAPVGLDSALQGGQADLADPLADFIQKQLPEIGPVHRPGILVLRRLHAEAEPIFVHLNSTADASAAATAFRQLFTAIRKAQSDTAKKGDFGRSLRLKLAKAGFTYKIAGRRSFAEIMIGIARFVRSHKGEIVTIATAGA